MGSILVIFAFRAADIEVAGEARPTPFSRLAIGAMTESIPQQGDAAKNVAATTVPGKSAPPANPHARKPATAVGRFAQVH